MNYGERLEEERRTRAERLSRASYTVKECFYSPQGEGHHVGRMNVFLRFTGCNLQCSEEREGFNCDTDFQGGTRLSLGEVVQLVKDTDKGGCKRVIFTGGEPALQVDRALCDALNAEGYFLCIETNGTLPVFKVMTHGFGVHWISCSPKRGHVRVLKFVDEVRCVVREGEAPACSGIDADHYFVSPACNAPPVGSDKRLPSDWHASLADLNRRNIAWAVRWCEDHPQWRVSLQTHKVLGVR